MEDDVTGKPLGKISTMWRSEYALRLFLNCVSHWSRSLAGLYVFVPGVHGVGRENAEQALRGQRYCCWMSNNTSGGTMYQSEWGPSVPGPGL